MTRSNQYTYKNMCNSVQAGFTLIELLVVVAILGILAAVGIPQYQGYQAQAKANAVKTTHSNMKTYIANEFAKCSAGATNILEDAATPTACSSTVTVMKTAFVAYAKAKGWKNPYDSTKDAVVAGAVGTVDGTTYLNDDAAATITIASVWTEGGVANAGKATDTAKKE